MSSCRRFGAAADRGRGAHAAEPLGIEVKCGRQRPQRQAGCFGVLLQYPGADGEVEDYRALVQAVHAQGGLVAVAPTCSRSRCSARRESGAADVVLGSAQRFGVPLDSAGRTRPTSPPGTSSGQYAGRLVG